MKHKLLIAMMAILSTSSIAGENEALQQEIQQLQQQSKTLQKQIAQLQKKVGHASRTSARGVVTTRPRTVHRTTASRTKSTKASNKNSETKFHNSVITVHTVDHNPSSLKLYPTALLADGKVLTYVAGTPIVTSPYLGDRPAFDGSDYLVNISSINRDIRLMQQRRRLYNAYESIGYPIPNMPIIMISGKAEPAANINNTYLGRATGDINLGSSELDVTAALNSKVEAFMSIAYDDSPPPIGPRVDNSAFSLNLGFVNIGDLDQSPFYFTAGQLYVPFGRYSSSMISSPISLVLARTKSRPFILGYKSQGDSGPYAAVYGFKSDTSLGHAGIGGVNLGYIINNQGITGDIGVGYIGSITDSSGMQLTGSAPYTTFGGFASITNGSELVTKVPAFDVHGDLSFDRYSITAEWVGTTERFNPQYLSFNGRGAKPQAAQIELGMTFMSFDRPSSIGVGYQQSKDTLALNLPRQRVSAVYNISIWKDTVESIEYRHDSDFRLGTYANGVPAIGGTNLNTLGSGSSSDSVIAQIGVYF